VAERPSRASSARDAMRPIALVLREDEDAGDAARRLFAQGQAAAPVLDAAGRLVGVLSQADAAACLGESSSRAQDFYVEPERASAPARPAAAVRELMSRALVSVSEDTPLDEVERRMLRRRVPRALVVRDGRALGVISASDLPRAR
jgi:CBS domain-containing protein